MSLTKKRMDSLRFDGRTLCFYPDGADGIPNFGVRVFKSGRKSFLLGYRLPGSRRQQWVTIGKYGVLTLDQAREKARAILVAVDQGEDPKFVEAPKITLAEYASVYIDNCKVRKVKTWKRMRSRLDRRILPALGHKPMEEIRRQDCIRLHATISASEGQPLVEANRCLEIVQAMFTRAELEGAISEGHYNPVAGLDFHSEESRTRYLDQLELKRLEKALRAEPLHIQCMVRLFLLLGLRKVGTPLHAVVSR